MPDGFDPRIAAVCRRVLGATPDAVTPLAGSVTNASALVEVGGRRIVVKTCPERDRVNETTALQLLAATGVPVAPLLGSGTGADGPWLALGFVPGGPATAAPAPDAIREQAGRALRWVHEVELPAFGCPGRPFRSWREALLDRLDADLADTVAAGLLPRQDADRLGQLVDGVLPYTGPPRLLHGDLKDVHLHADGDHLVAILDWGDARGGDPLYDLARYSFMGDAALAALLRGHGPVDLDADRLCAYRLRFAVDCLATELRAGGDWFDTYRGWIAADLA